MLTTFFLKDCLCQMVQFLLKGKNIVLTFVNCLVLQPTIIFTSLGRTILWEYVGLGILFLDPDFLYFWIMVVLIHCAVQWKLFFIELNCSQTVASPGPQQCAGLSLGLFRKLVGNAMRMDRVVTQKLCLVRSVVQNEPAAGMQLSAPTCVPVGFPQNIESRLKVSLPSDLGAALTDGVVLCHLANHVRPRSVPSIHVPSPAVVSV